MRLSIIAILLSISAMCFGQTISIGESSLYFNDTAFYWLLDTTEGTLTIEDGEMIILPSRAPSLEWKTTETISEGDSTCQHAYITKTEYRTSYCLVLHYNEVCDQDLDRREAICKKCHRYIKEQEAPVYKPTYAEEPDFFELLKKQQ